MPAAPHLNLRLILALLLAPLLVAGCALFPSPAEKALRRSPDFRLGYSDGCASAGLQGANPRETSYTRDEAAWRGNKAYHAGWSRGLGACRPTVQPGSGPLATPGMGGGATPF